MLKASCGWHSCFSRTHSSHGMFPSQRFRWEAQGPQRLNRVDSASDIAMRAMHAICVVTARRERLCGGPAKHD